MKDILKLIVSLGLVCFLGCAVLAWAKSKTEAPIRDAAAQQLNEQLNMAVCCLGVSCEFPEDCREELDGVVFHRGYAGKDLRVVVAESSARGFGGEIGVLVGIDLSMRRIAQVVISRHSETAGLGTQATDRSVRKSLWRKTEIPAGRIPENAFLDGNFMGHVVSRFAMATDPAGSADCVPVSGVSGATYSSRGVTVAVDRAMAVFLAHEAQVLKKAEE